jgi:uncharacterized membrane protein YsdA (DUF1294 family)/cold shock CspA family protein
VKLSGVLIRWNDEKGFGFIKSRSSEQDLFVHISSFPKFTKRPTVNMALHFEPSHDKQGRPCATNIRVAHTEGVKISAPVFAVIIFFTALTLCAVSDVVSLGMVLFYSVISLATFLVYWQDKSAAQKEVWRVNENSLHLLSLLGGWPGGLIARHLLRHKTVKQPFRFLFWCTTLTNIALLLALHYTPIQELFSVNL